MALMQHVAERVLPYVVALQTRPNFKVSVGYGTFGALKSATIRWHQNEYEVTFDDEALDELYIPQAKPYHTTEPDVAYYKAISFEPRRPEDLEVSYYDSTWSFQEYLASKVKIIPDDQFRGILAAQRTLPRPDALMGWTGSDYFRRIQRHLRGERDNAPLASQFRADFANHARIAPDRPREARQLTFLYRGICGPRQQASLDSCGHLESAGFLATSTSRSVAQNFANDRFRTSLEAGGGFVARIPIDSIPDGTPWLWYDWDVQTMTPIASEVLLPPGRLRLVDPASLTFAYVAY